MSRLEEIKAVKQLGEAIGYGNMMDIASALWSLKLEREYGISGGMHVPTVMPYWTEDAKPVEEMIQALSNCFEDNPFKDTHTIPYYGMPNNRVVYSMLIWGDYYLD